MVRQCVGTFNTFASELQNYLHWPLVLGVNVRTCNVWCQTAKATSAWSSHKFQNTPVEIFHILHGFFLIMWLCTRSHEKCNSFFICDIWFKIFKNTKILLIYCYWHYILLLIYFTIFFTHAKKIFINESNKWKYQVPPPLLI